MIEKGKDAPNSQAQLIFSNGKKSKKLLMDLNELEKKKLKMSYPMS
jgi:hypothetical protein